MVAADGFRGFLAASVIAENWRESCRKRPKTNKNRQKHE
jgi:hypothetical protein